MKDAYYFSHDSNARNDPKILAMRSQYGYEGYGWFWAFVEMMREQESFKLPMQPQCIWNAYALQLQCNVDAVYKFVEDCINEFKLFASDGEFFWSESLLKRMKQKNEKSEKARAAALSRWKCESNADVMQTHSERNAIKGKESKVKESKVKDIIIISSSKGSDWQKIQEAWNNNIHPMTQIERENLLKWMDELSPELILMAIEEAVKSNVRTMRYIDGILINWHGNGLLTKEAVLSHMRDREDEKKKRQVKKAANTEDDEPAWMKMIDWGDEDDKGRGQQNTEAP